MFESFLNSFPLLFGSSNFLSILFVIALGLLIGLFVGAAGMSEDAIWGYIIPFQIYTVVGIWRSANKYKGAKFWAILAKVAVVFGIISNLLSMITGV